MNLNNIRKQKTENKDSGLWKYAAVSVIVHLLIFSAAALDFNFASEKTDLRKSSMNVAIVEKAPESKQEKNAPDKKSGKNIEARKKSVTEKKPETEKKAETEKIKETEQREFKDKKPLVSGKKKRLPEPEKTVKKEKQPKKDNQVSNKQKAEPQASETGKEQKEVNDNSRVTEDIEQFRKDIQKESANSDDNGFFSDLSQGAKLEKKIEIYSYKIASEVEKKWALPSEVANSGEDLETAVVFTVTPEGRISNIWFDKKSGNNYFDESVFRAVHRAAPFSPYPEGIDRDFVTIGLRFTPKGLK
ncbi:MAG: TonB family protein [Thermodesulfobacteriota bacterium]